MTAVVRIESETQPRHQQRAALNVLKFMMDDGTIYVDEVDRNGNVTSLDICHSTTSALPADFGSLFPELSALQLFNCRNLTDVSSIGGIRKLRELCLCRCPVLREFPEELCERLKKLKLENCNAFDYDFSLRNLEGLEEFRFQDDNLEQVPLIIWSLSNLKRLVLFGSRLTAIPNEIGDLTHLEDLGIKGWRISSLSREIGSLVHLKNAAFYLEDIAELPDEMGALTALESVDLSFCSSLKRIPAPVLQLPRLEHLDLSYCPVLSIPDRDILECTDSLVEVAFENEPDDFSYDEDGREEEFRGVRDDSKRALELLQHMAWLNKNGRYLLKNKCVSLALWGVVLGRCSNNYDANSLFFLLKQKPDVIPQGYGKRK